MNKHFVSIDKGNNLRPPLNRKAPAAPDKLTNKRKDHNPMHIKTSIIRGKEINIPDCNIYNFLLNRSKINASNVLCRCHEDELTLERLKTDSAIYAKALKMNGVKAGDIVPICTEPGITAIILFFAINRIGAISTFLNATANSNEIISYINRFSARTFIFSDRLSLDIDKIKHKTDVKNFYVIRRSEAFDENKEISKLTKIYLSSSDFDYSAVHSVKELYHEGVNCTLAADESCERNNAAYITFTSGTTGEPKSIMLTNENIIAEMISLKKTTYMQLGPRGNALQVVPFNYPYGFLISVLFPMVVGKTAALTPALTVNTIASYLKMYKPVYISAIPSFYKSFLKNDEICGTDLSFLRYPVCGGDVITVAEMETLNRFVAEHGSKGKILNGSGNGEGCGSLTNPISLFEKYNINSIGKPIYGLSVKFVDDNGDIVPVGETGKFCFSGKNVMHSYFKDEEGTGNVKYTDSDGIEWFHTDTFGHFDKNGWVYFDGRERRFFITYAADGSPYKVYCDHVQNVIKGHSEVIDCAVVKKNDDARYYVPVAFVVSENFDSKLLSELKLLCCSELQECAVPCEFIHIDKLPLTEAGKIDYSTLEEQM